MGIGDGWKYHLMIRFFFVISLTFVIIEPVSQGNHIVEKVFLVKESNGEWVDAVEQVLTMKVMTYNIRHGRGLDGKVNLQRIANDIQNSGADIVALQEVDRFNIRSGFSDQPRILAKKTGLDSWAFATSMRWGFARYGNAILSKYPILSTEEYILPGNSEKRSILKCIIQIGEQQVTIFNTHLGLKSDEREFQVSQITNILEKTEGPAVLMGDFNMETDHALLERMLHGWDKVQLSATSATVLGGQEIDHIYVNYPMQGYQAYTIQTDSSDHDPVIGTWTWTFGPRVIFAASNY